MAQLYVLEPQTNAKVLLKTDFGDIELELWGRETPLTTRNFLQLCYDNYYSGTIFHRLVPGFILQGGDPTGTGHGGEATYPGGLFADEFHPRLRFNRRGLVGMANSGRKDDNGSQFFLTLGDTKELTGKNTLFGKIVGDTVYNLVRMGELETDKATERPSFPPKILSTEVLVNPFDDLKPQEVKPKADVLERPKKLPAKKKGRKALLSFGGDEDGEPVVPMKKKPKFDTRIVVAGPEGEEKPQIEKSSPKPSKTSSNAEVTATARPRSLTPLPAPTLKTRKRTPPPIDSRSPSPPPSKSETLLAQTNAQIAALKKLLRRSPSPPPTTVVAASSKKKSLLALQKAMLPATSVQGRKRKRGKKAEEEDEEAFFALQKFRAKLAAAPVSNTPPPDPQAQTDAKAGNDGNNEGEKANEEEQDPDAALCDLHFIPNCQSCSSWDRAVPNGERESEGGEVSEDLWSHTLSFERDRLGKDLNWKKKNEELVVIDPREKQKEVLKERRKGRRGDDRFRSHGRGGRGWGERGEGSERRR